MSKININIESELDPLKKVIVHTPGIEMSYLDRLFTEQFYYNFFDNSIEENELFLLWDDMIYLPKAIEEHREMCKIINILSGEDACVQFKDLFLDILDNKDIVSELINEVLIGGVTSETLSSLHKNEFADFSKQTDSLLDVEMELIAEIENKFKNIQDKNILYDVLLSGQVPIDNLPDFRFYSTPIVNLLFTRDLAFSFGNTTVITWNSKFVRNRENTLIKYLFKYHPLLKENKFIFFNQEFPHLTIEGGDVMIFDADTILIGLSERTKKESVEALLPYFMNEGFSNIIGVSIKEERSFMHLDTVLTKINKHEYLHYEGVQDEIECFEFNESNPRGKKLGSIPLLKDLIYEIDNNAKTFKCDHDEQWTCGSNALAVRPGKILLYERNERTIENLVVKGEYKAYNPKEIINGDFDKNEKIVVRINGSELSRGRGGARCMTMPLIRG